jgi:hypothetical protein
MLPRRLRATYREMGIPHKSVSSSTHSSSEDLSSQDKGVSQPLHEAPADLPANQEQAIDQFMVDWFASDEVNNMSSNPKDERVNVDNPHFPNTARGQKRWQEARAHARTPIFQGARLSRLAAILELLNIQAKHKASNTMLSDIFQFCHSLLLPEINVLPGSWKKAKQVFSSIGMEYEIVHACINDCMLFHGSNAHLIECSTCKEARYDTRIMTGKVPRKSVRWFPIIPRLLHTYRCTKLAELMTWHKKHRSKDGVMRLIVDSTAHKHVESTWPEFERDHRHVRLGLASDGVSPHSLGGKDQPTSIWPAVLMNYNLPPWLSMKKGFLLLSLIIPGPTKVKNLDTYLSLLVNELKQLWDEVWAYDGRKTTRRIPREFRLKAIYMWTMHDYPGKIKFMGKPLFILYHFAFLYSWLF